MSANETEVGREDFSAETEDFPPELGDGPDVVAETMKEIATLNIPSTQEFHALSPLNPGKKRKSSSKEASCPPKSRKKETATISKGKSNSSRPSCRSRLSAKSLQDSRSLNRHSPRLYPLLVQEHWIRQTLEKM